MRGRGLRARSWSFGGIALTLAVTTPVGGQQETPDRTPAHVVLTNEQDRQRMMDQLNITMFPSGPGAYLASTEDITFDSKWEGLKGFFKEGLFALRITGTGMLFFSAYGQIEEIQVEGEYVVDNGYAVAWDPSLQFKLTKARKIRSFLFSDQLLTRFSGSGRLWIQSRSPYTLANWVWPFRPQSSS